MFYNCGRNEDAILSTQVDDLQVAGQGNNCKIKDHTDLKYKDIFEDKGRAWSMDQAEIKIQMLLEPEWKWWQSNNQSVFGGATMERHSSRLPEMKFQISKGIFVYGAEATGETFRWWRSTIKICKGRQQ